MGDAFDLYEMGILDEMGEYIGDGVDYRERRKGKRRHDPRKGVLTYIHRLYIGKAKMPSALKIAKHYAEEKKIEWKTEEEMFNKISADFTGLVQWLSGNAGKMYNTY